VQNPGATAGLSGLHIQLAAELIAESNIISNIAETGIGSWSRAHRKLHRTQVS
jgi:hypothetical protein